MKVLCIDGPSRGMVRDVGDSRHFPVAIPPEVTPLAFGPDKTHSSSDDLSYTVVTYHVHMFYLLGRYLRLASIHLDADKSDPKDSFDAIVSERAKQVAE